MDNVESPENFEPDYGKYCLNSKGLNSLYRDVVIIRLLIFLEKVAYRKQSFGDARSIYTNIYKDTSRRMQGIWFILLRWRGSVFKMVIKFILM